MMKYKDHKFFSSAKDIGSQLQKVEAVVLTKAAIMVTASAVGYAKYKTGTLRESITYEVHKHYATVGTNIEYAVFLEYGTKNMGPYPFMRPAFDHNRGKIISMAIQEMRKIK